MTTLIFMLRSFLDAWGVKVRFLTDIFELEFCFFKERGGRPSLLRLEEREPVRFSFLPFW